MVQPFAFPKQSETSATCRNSRRSRGTGTVALRTDSDPGSSTPRISDYRRSRTTRKAHLAVPTKKFGCSNSLSGYGAETCLEDSDDVSSGLDKSSPLQEIALKGQEIFWFLMKEELSSREKAQPGCLRDLNIPPSKQRYVKFSHVRASWVQYPLNIWQNSRDTNISYFFQRPHIRGDYWRGKSYSEENGSRVF